MVATGMMIKAEALIKRFVEIQELVSEVDNQSQSLTMVFVMFWQSVDRCVVVKRNTPGFEIQVAAASWSLPGCCHDGLPNNVIERATRSSHST